MKINSCTPINKCSNVRSMKGAGISSFKQYPPPASTILH